MVSTECKATIAKTCQVCSLAVTRSTCERDMYACGDLVHSQSIVLLLIMLLLIVSSLFCEWLSSLFAVL